MYYLFFEPANTFHFEGEQKREKTFSDIKLRVRTSPVRYNTVRLWYRLRCFNMSVVAQERLRKLQELVTP